MENEEIKKEIEKLEGELAEARRDYANTSYGRSIALTAIGGGITLISGIYLLTLLCVFLFTLGHVSYAGYGFIVCIILCLIFLSIGIPMLIIGLKNLNKKKIDRRIAKDKIDSLNARLAMLHEKNLKQLAKVKYE